MVWFMSVLLVFVLLYYDFKYVNKVYDDETVFETAVVFHIMLSFLSPLGLLVFCWDMFEYYVLEDKS
jgi:hypothetical protein